MRFAVAIHYHKGDKHSVECSIISGARSPEEAIGVALMSRDKKYDGWAMGACHAVQVLEGGGGSEREEVG